MPPVESAVAVLGSAKPLIKRLLLVSALFSIGLSAHAATYYVDGSPTGCGGVACQDSNPGTSTSTAFATPGGCVTKFALNPDQPDDCQIKNSTYIGAGPDLNTPYWNFNISGLSTTQPKRVRAYPGHTPILCHTAGCTTSGAGPVIGVYKQTAGQTRYIEFSGLTVKGLLSIRGAASGQVSDITVTVTGIKNAGVRLAQTAD